MPAVFIEIIAVREFVFAKLNESFAAVFPVPAENTISVVDPEIISGIEKVSRISDGTYRVM